MRSLLTQGEAYSRVTERLSAQRAEGEVWSTDFFAGTELLAYLASSGRDGTYGDTWEDLSDPLALHVPGVIERTTAAFLAASADTGIHVTPDSRAGRTPLYGLSGDYVTAGLVDLRGVVLALVSYYVGSDAPAPAEFIYAVRRVSASGTHVSGVSREFAKSLKKGPRA